MNKKQALIGVIILLVVGGIMYWAATSAPTNQDVLVIPTEESGRVANPETVTETAAPATDGKLKAANFSGRLEKTDESCFADGECYVIIDGKHITTTIGWSRDTVGSILGVESFGDMKDHIGEEFEVYAQDKGDGTYTLYGSEGFYIKKK